MYAAAIATGLVALALSSAVGGPSLSSVLLDPESRYTDLSAGCRAEAGDAGPGACPGLGGAKVRLSVEGARTTLAFAWPGSDTAEVVLDGRIEPRLEWRGVATSRGFQPHAALVRLEPVDGAGRREVAVIRIRHGEACRLGAATATAGVDAAERARSMADGATGAMACAGEPDHVAAGG